jgi:tetratricopeptide (TPR) repeat protein
VGQLFDGCFATRPEDRPSAQLLRGRIEFLVDWIGIDAIGAELAYVARDPLGYAARVAPTRVARAKQQAEHALAKGERLAALRHVDRGLAYAPEDAELRALEVRASTVAVEPVAAHSQEVEPPPPSRLQQPRTWALLGVAGLALAGGGTGLGVWIARSPRTPAASASASVALVASSAPAMASTVLAPPPADIAVPTRPRGPFPDVPGIALEDLPNDAPKEPLKDIARPGEPLVPPRLFAGVGGPGPGLASIERQIAEKPADEDLQVGRALALLANRRDAEAFALFSRLEAAHPDDLATLWAAKGFVALRQGKLDDAEAHLSKAIRLDPKDASSYRNRAILRSRAGRLRDAYGDLMAALALQPENLDALEEMARLYDRAKRRRDAVGLIERVVRLRPSDVDAWIDLSVAQGETDLEAAHASVQRALAIAPRNPRAHERLCAVLARKEVPEAVGACTRALELAPGSASVLNNRGMAYYRQGEDVRALADLDRAIAARPTDTSYLINRYLVRAHAGRNDARADLEAACKLGASAACEELAKR